MPPTGKPKKESYTKEGKGKMAVVEKRDVKLTGGAAVAMAENKALRAELRKYKEQMWKLERELAEEGETSSRPARNKNNNQMVLAREQPMILEPANQRRMLSDYSTVQPSSKTEQAKLALAGTQPRLDPRYEFLNLQINQAEVVKTVSGDMEVDEENEFESEDEDLLDEDGGHE